MSPKKDSSSSNQNGHQTQITLAVIGLVSALGVAYLGYRQATDPQRFSASLTATAVANQVLAPATNTLTISPTDTLIPTSEPSATATTEVVFTPTPQPLISSTCLFSGIWDYTPRKAIPTDGCWMVSEFLPLDNGVQMADATSSGPGEKQRGFYALLNGDADIQFTVKINAFESQKITSDKTKRSNLAFGIVEGSPFAYYNGVYVYYYASSPEMASYDLQLTKEQDVAYNSALTVDREQTIRFKVQGRRLTVYINGIAINAYTLTFNQNAFYFGYRLFESTDLSASISNLTFTP